MVSKVNSSIYNGSAVATVATEEISLLDQIVANTLPVAPGAPVAKVKVPSAEQKAEITQLRGRAAVKGGIALVLAQTKCNGTYSAAEQYIALLKVAIDATPAPVVVDEMTPVQIAFAPAAAPAVQPITTVRKTAGVVVGLKGATPKQWSYIRHLRGKLYGIGEGWANTLAKRSIDNNSRAASAYIKDMISALRRRYEASPEARTGGRVCSICWQSGCNIGPMVSR